MTPHPHELGRQRPRSAWLAALSQPASRIWIATLAVGMVVGIGAGAMVARFMTSDQPVMVTASSMIRVFEPSNLAAMATGGSDQPTQGNAENYVSGELAYLSGSGFAQAVGNALGARAPDDISVTQNGTSSVLTLTADWATNAEAVKTVQAAVDLYERQLRERRQQQARSVLSALDRWAKEAGYSAESPAPADLRATRDRVELQAAQPGGVELMQLPTEVWSAGTSQQSRLMTLFGGLVGGLLVVTVLTAYRNRSHRLRSAALLAEAVDSVIVPAVDLSDRLPSHTDPRGAAAGRARTILAQCAATAPAPVVAVVGASGRSGTAHVAALLAFAAAEHGPVTKVTLTDAGVTRADLTGGHGALIIDAGPIGSSALAAEAVAAATHVLLVARLNVDCMSDVLAASSATELTGVPLQAVVTYRPWWGNASPIGADEVPAVDRLSDWKPAEAVIEPTPERTSLSSRIS
jgi:uncharacterized membrane protein YeaQ/YmgE (transglycosylase-associated protein family)